MNTVWMPILGALIVGAALREIFHDLFHPTNRGVVSGHLARLVFGVARRRPALLPLAGPGTLVLVIGSWVVLLILGFALVYGHDFPDRFEFSSSSAGAAQHAFWGVLNYSAGALTTVIGGSASPKPMWLRLVVTFEALVGLSVLTASVSWIVLLYPALGRMRSLARRTTILAEAEKGTGVSVVAEGLESLLGELSLELIRTRVELVHFPIIYYFYADNRTASLAHAIPYLQQFAESGSKPDSPERVQLASAVLDSALHDLAAVLAAQYFRMDAKDTRAVFRKYAEQHARRE